MLDAWQDKHDLTHSAGNAVLFDLNVEAFTRGSSKNSGEQLQALKRVLCPAEEHFVPLISAPLSTVTLPEPARVKAGIPPEAMFYCFCYPLVSTYKPNSNSKATSHSKSGDASAPRGLEGGAHEIMTDDDTEVELVLSRVRKVDGMKLDMDDPFVNLLLVGGFLYFNHTYDICAINSVSFREARSATTTAALYLGASSPLPRMAVAPLEEAQRWKSVTARRLLDLGFTHFSWVCPSEFIGDSIFTRSGGFAYLHADVAQSIYVPVMPKTMAHPDNKLYAKANPSMLRFEGAATFKPLPYNAPLHIPELAAKRDSSMMASNADKFMATPEAASFDEGNAAALGIRKALFGPDEDANERAIELYRMAAADGGEGGLQVMKDEVNAMKGHREWDVDRGVEMEKDYGHKVCSEWLDYVLDKPAKEKSIVGNDNFTTVQDDGNEGKTLRDFMAKSEARTAELTVYEVAALRYYTTAAFKWINDPLRRKIKPVPLPGTTLFIYDALKKLRAVHLTRNEKFQARYLWRGMKDRTVARDFLMLGGSERACMSTSESLPVVAGYASSRTPLLFRIKVESPMDLGAKIDWCSVFPGEQEVLYPPLTFLKPMFEQPIMGQQGQSCDEGVVVTVKPSFPS